MPNTIEIIIYVKLLPVGLSLGKHHENSLHVHSTSETREQRVRDLDLGLMWKMWSQSPRGG